MTFYVYWISTPTGRRHYIGATVKPERRLRQHNGDIKGGARRTRGQVWRFKCIVTGFRTWREALQFEWAFKYHCRGCRSVLQRQRALENLMHKPQWTSKSPPSADVPLTICLYADDIAIRDDSHGAD